MTVLHFFEFPFPYKLILSVKPSKHLCCIAHISLYWAITLFANNYLKLRKILLQLWLNCLPSYTIWKTYIDTIYSKFQFILYNFNKVFKSLGYQIREVSFPRTFCLQNIANFFWTNWFNKIAEFRVVKRHDSIVSCLVWYTFFLSLSIFIVK